MGEEEMEAQRGEVIGPRSQSKDGAKAGCYQKLTGLSQGP